MYIIVTSNEFLFSLAPNWIVTDRVERKGGQAWNSEAGLVLPACLSQTSGHEKDTTEHNRDFFDL